MQAFIYTYINLHVQIYIYVYTNMKYKHIYIFRISHVALQVCTCFEKVCKSAYV